MSPAYYHVSPCLLIIMCLHACLLSCAEFSMPAYYHVLNCNYVSMPAYYHVLNSPCLLIIMCWIAYHYSILDNLLQHFRSNLLWRSYFPFWLRILRQNGGRVVNMFFFGQKRPIMLLHVLIQDTISQEQHYVIKFVSVLRQVSGFLQVLHFPIPIKRTARR